MRHGVNVTVKTSKMPEIAIKIVENTDMTGT